MADYREILGKVEGLQRGFTSGTCAQAASKAATIMLISKRRLKEVSVELKDGRFITIPIINPIIGEDCVSCSVIKDSGDDKDITNGKEFCSEVSWSENGCIEITGGLGIGVVTSVGLPVAVGNYAINPNPIKMITKSLKPLIEDNQGLQVKLSVPEGVQLAKDTWNSRIGIEGGISIIGTSGIVEPKSSKAYKASIVLQLNVLKKRGCTTVYLTPGYVGEGYLKSLEIVEQNIVKFGDYAGYALDCAASKGFKNIQLVGHIGKMAKIASGIFNTHCKYGDARLETIAAFAGAAGADRETILKLLSMKTAEESISFLKDKGLENTYSLINLRLLERSLLRVKKEMNLHSIILDLKGTVISDEVMRGSVE